MRPFFDLLFSTPTQVNGGSSATVDTVNGEPLTASPAGGGALLFRGRQSAATTVRTDQKTCNSVVDFINQVRWASSRPLPRQNLCFCGRGSRPQLVHPCCTVHQAGHPDGTHVRVQVLIP